MILSRSPLAALDGFTKIGVAESASQLVKTFSTTPIEVYFHRYNSLTSVCISHWIFFAVFLSINTQVQATPTSYYEAKYLSRYFFRIILRLPWSSVTAQRNMNEVL
jgi:hypothetical protein